MGQRYGGEIADANRHYREALNTLPQADLVPGTIRQATIRREAALSSQIEGTETDVEDLTWFDSDALTDDVPRDLGDVVAAVTGLEDGLKAVQMIRSPQVFTVYFICSLHRILKAETKDQDGPGALRTVQNFFSGTSVYDSLYVPPPPDRVPGLLDDLTGFLRVPLRTSADSGWPLSAVLGIAHAQFELIHPFQDGNGRIGRMLIPLTLAAHGHQPLAMGATLKAERGAYYDALLALGQTGDWYQWLRFFIPALKRSIQSATALVTALAVELERWARVLSDVRSDALLWRLPALLIAHPVLTVERLARLERCSKPAANTAISQAAALGLVTQITRGNRNRVFRAAWALDLLDDGIRRARPTRGSSG